MNSATNALPLPEVTALLEEAPAAEEGLIAQVVLPVIDQPTRNGQYPRLRRGKGELMKAGSTKRARDGSYNEGTRSFEWDDYACQEYGHEERVDDANEKEMARFFDMATITARLCRRPVLLDYEKRVADTMADYSGNGFTKTATAVQYIEANLATIDVFKDTQAAIARMIKKGNGKPNALIWTRDVWDLVRRTPKLQTYLFGLTNQDIYKNVTPELVAKQLEVGRVIIAEGAYDSAPKDTGGTFTGSYIWSSSYIWLANLKSGDFKEGGLGRTITWAADCPGGLLTTETYRDEKRRGDMIRVRAHTAEKIVDNSQVEMLDLAGP